MKRLIVLFIVLLGSLALSKSLIYLDETGNTKIFSDIVITDQLRDYVRLDVVNDLSRGVVISQSLRQEETIMILPSGAIVSLSHKTMKATVEFGNEFENSLIIRNNVVYINSELLSIITERPIQTGEDTLIMYARPLIIKAIDNNADYLKITLDRDVLPDFFNVWWTGSGSLALTFSPAVIEPTISDSRIAVTTGRGFVKLAAQKNWGDIEYEIDGKSVLFRNQEGLGRTVDGEIQKDYILSVYESYIDGRRFEMSYLEMDVAGFNFSVQLANNGIGGLEKATDILLRSDGTVMINGGYFDQNQNLPIGLLIKDGKVLGLPSLGRPAVYFTQSGRVYVSRMDIVYLVWFGTRFVQINAVNSVFRAEAALYTDEYRNTIPNFDGFRYFVLGDGKILSEGYIRSVQRGQTVLALSPSAIQKSGRLRVGDSFALQVMNSSGEILTAAVEGGPMLIHNGNPVTDYERNFYSPSLIDVRAPRTLVGVKDTGQAVFIVIDGYQVNSYGLTMKEMIEFFKDKGFTSLMCLDGGKSSIMSVEGTVVNNPSSGVPSLPVVIIGTRK
jgi:exopolysaccharide biosynthesis protein